MLAAIIANLQNQSQPQQRLPTIHIDRGGGGPSWPRYELVDIMGAMAAFPEIAGEHPVVRAVRRHQWIGEALPKIKEAREKREAAVFLAGASLADAAAEERHALMDKLKIEKLVEIIDAVRAETGPQSPAPLVSAPIATPARSDRGANRVMGLALGFFLGGLTLGVVLGRKKGSVVRMRRT